MHVLCKNVPCCALCALPFYSFNKWICMQTLDRKIKSFISHCFGAVQPRVVFFTRRILPAIQRDFFPLFNQVMSYMKTCATEIVGTWVEHPDVCRKKSASMCRSLFGTEPIKNENNQNAKLNQLILYLLVTRQLEIICYTTKKCTSHY